MTIFEIISALLYRDYFESFSYNIIAKMVLVSYIAVNFLFCKYLMNVCKRTKVGFNILYVFTVIVLLLTLFTTTEYVENNGAVATSLKHIDKSRPFFLCFIGQRIGWIPNFENDKF